jgi:hypothetical protein
MPLRIKDLLYNFLDGEVWSKKREYMLWSSLRLLSMSSLVIGPVPQSYEPGKYITNSIHGPE